MKPTEELHIERQGAVLKLKLTRPSRANALSDTLVETLLEALDYAEAERVRLVAFSGEGKHFCSGFDLGNLDEQRDADLVYKLLRIERLLQRVTHAPFPTLALAHGRVMGAGTDLFCACSERIAVPGTVFRMPGWRFGIALGTRRFAARVGADTARAVLMESRVFSAEEGLAMGFVTAVVPETEWPAALDKSVKRAERLDWDSNRFLLNYTMEDTRAADMASLVETSTRPGLKERIIEYQRSEKAARSQ